MKTYIPREFDLPTYDRKEFFAQMEQEIMTIKLNPETYQPPNEYLVARKYRTITRETSMEGFFKQLTEFLQSVADQYSLSLEKVQEDFENLNCSKEKLIELYKKERYTKWGKLHDLALARMDKDSSLLAILETHFSRQEIEERKRFLGDENLK